MRSLIAVTALAWLSACSSEEVECPAILRQPVIVELVNVETERRISGATVMVSDGSSSIELMELARGQYGLWSEVPGTAVTAVHPDYYEASTALVSVSSECSFQQTATLRMQRKIPCNSRIPGVRAEVHDELDGSLIAGATVDLVDGIYSERMQEMELGLYEGAYDRSGIYDVVVRADGYRRGLVQSVWVEEDDCTVLTSSVALELPRDR